MDTAELVMPQPHDEHDDLRALLVLTPSNRAKYK